MCCNEVLFSLKWFHRGHNGQVIEGVDMETTVVWGSETLLTYLGSVDVTASFII